MYVRVKCPHILIICGDKKVMTIAASPDVHIGILSSLNNRYKKSEQSNTEINTCKLISGSMKVEKSPSPIFFANIMGNEM